MYQLSDLRNQVKDLVWNLVEKYYNLDKNDPIILTARQIGQFNQIDRLGSDIALIVEGLIAAALQYEKQKDGKAEDEKDKYADHFGWGD